MKKSRVTAGGWPGRPGEAAGAGRMGKGTGCRGHQGLDLGCMELEELPASWVNTQVQC